MRCAAYAHIVPAVQQAAGSASGSRTDTEGARFQVSNDAAGAVQVGTADPEAAYLGGGTNLVDHLKLGGADPAVLVDVTALTSDEIDDEGGGLRIGAAVQRSLGVAPRGHGA